MTTFPDSFPLKAADVVDDLQGVAEIVLVTFPVNRLYALETHQLGQDVFEQPRAVHKFEGDRRPFGQKHLAEFVGDTFLRQDRKAVLHAAHRIERLGNHRERAVRRGKLGGKTHCTQHPERVVAECDVGVERSADYTGGQVADAAERVDKRSEIVLLEAEGHGVDGEVATQLVVFERTVFHYGLAGFTTIRFLAGSDEFKLEAAGLQHRRAEIAVDGDMGMEARCDGFGKGDAAPLNHYVYVGATAAEKGVTYISADDKSADSKARSLLSHKGENRIVQESFYYRGISH